MVLTVGCGDDEDETPAPPCTEWLRDDGVCAAPGLPPDMPCPPGEWLRDAACLPAGVPPDGCGMGFVHDGDRGCDAILPAEPCGDGLMAVPGEASCSEVAPCASGTWGGIRVEPNTEYVDRSYTGVSDGSQAAPWTSIQAGVDAAAPGAIVAIAAGSYAEDVTVQGKAVRLWGKCASVVELGGTGTAPAALLILTAASGSEVRGIAITGQSGGVGHTGSENVRLDEVRIHDTTGRGISSEDAYGVTSLSLGRVLVERAHGHGVSVNGADVTLEATVVRDTGIGGQGLGRGINVQDGFASGARATLHLTRSLIEGNGELGIFVGGSDAIIDTTVIRDTLPDPQGNNGRGMSIVDNPMTAARATVVVTSSIIERNFDAGIFAEGSDVTLETTVLRNTWTQAEDAAIGIAAKQNPTTGGIAKLDVATSLIEGTQGVGVAVSASEAIVNASVVRHTAADTQGAGGRGLQAQDDPTTGARATVEVRASLFEHNVDHGLFIAGSDATLEAVWVRDTPGLGATAMSSAFQVQRRPESGAPGSATLRACLIERSAYAAIAVVGPASVDVEACTLRETTTLGGILGDGLLAIALDGAANASVVGTRIEHSQRAAVSSFGGSIALGSSAFVCQSFDIASEAWMASVPVFDDRGGITCGCPEATAHCVAQSYALAPPGGIE